MSENVTMASEKGLRPYQEDCSFAFRNDVGDLLGVFDGHGGADCAYYLDKHFVSAFLQEALDAPLALRNTFSRLAMETSHMYAGSTASVVWIPRNGDKATFAVLGDSPILAETDNGLDISPEHNARTNITEREAAVARGAYYSGGYLFAGWGQDGLQMGRAFGDAKLSFISHEPEIYQRAVKEFVLVATDGVFDPSHTQMQEETSKVLAMISNGKDAQAIVDRALQVPTHDNATAVLWRRLESQ